MFDLVVVDGSHHVSAFRIAGLVKEMGELKAVVEVPPFEGERKASEVIKQRLRRAGAVPNMPVDGEVAEGPTVRLHSADVHTRVALLIDHDEDEFDSEIAWGVGEGEECPSHHLQGLQLVVGHDVVGDASLRRIDERRRLGHLGSARSAIDPQRVAPLGKRDSKGRASPLIGDRFHRSLKLRREIRRKEYSLGELSDLHIRFPRDWWESQPSVSLSEEVRATERSGYAVRQSARCQS